MFWSVVERFNGLGFSLRHCHKPFEAPKIGFLPPGSF